MQAYPNRGNPVLDALTGRISVRQLRVMIEHLPPNNAVARALNGPWGDIEYLLRDIANNGRVLNTSYYNTHRAKGLAAQPLELMPKPEISGQRPDAQDDEQVQSQREHLLAVLARPRAN
jgi:hypothetical protein